MLCDAYTKEVVMPNEFKLELTVWSKAGLEASTAALDRLHSRGIATHFLENGVLMEELPDGTVRPFDDGHPSSTAPQATDPQAAPPHPSA